VVTVREPGRKLRVDALRSVRGKIDGILTDLEDSSRRSPHANLRASKRYSCRLRLSVGVKQPGGTEATYDVIGRTISSGGLSFLHGGYLHVGTSCAMFLVAASGVRRRVTGTVVHCRHVDGRVHEVGVQFNEPIEADAFVSEQVQGAVLLVDDAPDFAGLTAHHLRRSGLEVAVADSAAQALELVRKRSFDVVITEVDLPETDGLALAAAMRSAGIDRPILAVSASSDSSLPHRCLSAGCDDFLAKPLDRARLVDAIRQHLGQQEVLLSKYADSPDMAEFIDQFLSGLMQRVFQMRQHLADYDAGALAAIARRLKAVAGGSGGCGYDAISEVAGNIEEAVSQGANLEVVTARLKELTALCRRACAGRPRSQER